VNILQYCESKNIAQSRSNTRCPLQGWFLVCVRYIVVLMYQVHQMYS
jgi:hypothetical protein